MDPGSAGGAGAFPAPPPLGPLGPSLPPLPDGCHQSHNPLPAGFLGVSEPRIKLLGGGDEHNVIPFDPETE